MPAAARLPSATLAIRNGPVLRASAQLRIAVLNRIAGLNVVHLRAGYFMENTLGQAAAIHAMGKSVGPLRGDLKLPMIAARDIGSAAAELLAALDFSGKQTRELLGQRDLSMDEATAIIRKTIEKPDLKYFQLPGEQMQPIFIQMGMSENVASLIWRWRMP